VSRRRDTSEVKLRTLDIALQCPSGWNGRSGRWTSWTPRCEDAGTAGCGYYGLNFRLAFDTWRLALLAGLDGGLDNMSNRTGVLSVCIDSL
jgi:hypothetical protein